MAHKDKLQPEGVAGNKKDTNTEDELTNRQKIERSALKVSNPAGSLKRYVYSKLYRNHFYLMGFFCCNL